MAIPKVDSHFDAEPSSESIPARHDPIKASSSRDLPNLQFRPPITFCYLRSAREVMAPSITVDEKRIKKRARQQRYRDKKKQQQSKAAVAITSKSATPSAKPVPPTLRPALLPFKQPQAEDLHRRINVPRLTMFYPEAVYSYFMDQLHSKTAADRLHSPIAGDLAFNPSLKPLYITMSPNHMIASSPDTGFDPKAAR